MKLVTFLAQDRSHHIGVLAEHEHKMADAPIVDLFEMNQTEKKFAPEVMSDMVQFIQAQTETLPWTKTILERAAAGNIEPSQLLNQSDCVIIAPVPRPTSCRDGYAFRQHVASAREGRGLPMIPEFDEFPVFYFTNHLAVTGPGELHFMPRVFERLDFELEVAIVVGKEARNLTAKNADDAIFGYMIMNDWSARELQTQEMKLNLGPAKGKDFATSIGPYLVTQDELEPFKKPSDTGNRYHLRMQAFHNGKAVSDGNLDSMNWTFAQILERVSYGVTIHPGEVIGSGTVGTGCYMELNVTTQKDNPVWIKPGDEMVLEVEGLGKLTNTVQNENF